MNHSELIAEIADRTGLKTSIIRAVLHPDTGLPTILAGYIGRDRPVRLSTIGRLVRYMKPARTIKNKDIQNGAAITYSPKLGVKLVSNNRDI